MRTRLQHARFTALVLLLSGLGLLPDAVFCIGDGGHQAIEFVSQVCCHSKASRNSDCADPGDHCASKCTDVRLAADVMPSKSSDRDLARDGIARICTVALVSPTLPPASPTEAMLLPGLASGPHIPIPRERHTTVQLC